MERAKPKSSFERRLAEAIEAANKSLAPDSYRLGYVTSALRGVVRELERGNVKRALEEAREALAFADSRKEA